MTLYYFIRHLQFFKLPKTTTYYIFICCTGTSLFNLQYYQGKHELFHIYIQETLKLNKLGSIFMQFLILDRHKNKKASNFSVNNEQIYCSFTFGHRNSTKLLNIFLRFLSCLFNEMKSMSLFACAYIVNQFMV